MRVLKGRVSGRTYGVASGNLTRVMSLIRERTGLDSVVPGTLNVALPVPYFVTPIATITRQEYNRLEEILLERCCIGGIRAVIMRPDSHERGAAHGPAHLELMAAVRLRDALALEDGAEVEIVVGEEQHCWEGASVGGGQ